MTEPKRIAGAILMAPDGSLILQRRDDDPSVSSPGMLSVFGGHAEAGESLEECARREIAEETGFFAGPGQLETVVEIDAVFPAGNRLKGGFFVIRNVNPSGLRITEGRMELIAPQSVKTMMGEMVPTTAYAIGVLMASGRL